MELYGASSIYGPADRYCMIPFYIIYHDNNTGYKTSNFINNNLIVVVIRNRRGRDRHLSKAISVMPNCQSFSAVQTSLSPVSL